MTSKALPSSDLKIDDNRIQGVSVDTAEAAEATEAEGLGASEVCEPPAGLAKSPNATFCELLICVA